MKSSFDIRAPRTIEPSSLVTTSSKSLCGNSKAIRIALSRSPKSSASDAFGVQSVCVLKKVPVSRLRKRNRIKTPSVDEREQGVKEIIVSPKPQVSKKCRL